MKRLVMILAVFTMLAAGAQAQNVGVLVDYSDGDIDRECVDVNSGDSAYDAIAKANSESSDISMVINGMNVPGFGSKHYVESINGYGESGSYYDDEGNYHAVGWNFWVAKGSKFVQPEFGPGNGMALDDYEVTLSEVIVLKYGTTVYSPSFQIIEAPKAPDYFDIGRVCLRISEMDIEVDGERQKNLDDGERIKEDTKPGSQFEISLKAESLIDDESDIQIEDVYILVEIERIDDGDTFEEESDETDINPDDEEELDLEFVLPIESDDRNYEMLVRIEGDGEDGNTYYDEWRLPFSYDLDSHELLIERAFLSSDTVMCSDTVYLDLRIYNIGERDEDEVRVEVESSRLGFKYVDSGIELDDDLTDGDSRYSERIPIQIPEDARAGIYAFEIRAYYDSNDLSDQVSVNLEIMECLGSEADDAPDSADDEQEEEVVVNIVDDGSFVPITGKVADKDENVDFLQENRFVIVVLAAILMILVIGVLVVAAIRR